jgi:hypothetical protein
MSGHGRVRRGKAALPQYWRIEPPGPTVFVTNPAHTLRLVRMTAAGIRVTSERGAWCG